MPKDFIKLIGYYYKEWGLLVNKNFKICMHLSAQK